MVSLLNLSVAFHRFPQLYVTWWGGEGSCMGLQELNLLRSQSLHGQAKLGMFPLAGSGGSEPKELPLTPVTISHRPYSSCSLLAKVPSVVMRIAHKPL